MSFLASVPAFSPPFPNNISPVKKQGAERKNQSSEGYLRLFHSLNIPPVICHPYLALIALIF